MKWFSEDYAALNKTFRPQVFDPAQWAAAWRRPDGRHPAIHPGRTPLPPCLGVWVEI